MYYPGHEFMLFQGNEGDAITEGTPPTAPTLPDAPATQVLVGQIDPADITDDDGLEPGFGAGHYAQLYEQSKLAAYEIAIRQRVANSALIARCQRVTTGGGATHGLPENAFFYGQTSDGGPVSVLRYAVCNTLECSFQEGQELSANMTFWALCRDAAVISPVPDLDEYRGVGAPMFWNDMKSFTIDGTPYRQELMGISFSINHNLERKGMRPSYTGGSVLDRCAYALLPHHLNGSGELSLHDPIAVGYDLGSIAMTIGTQVWTLEGCTRQSFRQPGVESGAQLTWNIPFTFRSFSIA